MTQAEPGHFETSILDLFDRLAARDWVQAATELDEQGWTVLHGLFAPEEADTLAALYERAHFRSHIVMERYNFGRGDYKYFSYPLPQVIAALRSVIYPHLVPVANRWNAAMGINVEFPPHHEEFVARCHAAGQSRPTPLMLDYGPEGFCALHQDLYGEQVFPLQVVTLLSQPGTDFSGGEFVLVEQRPRMQSRPEVVPLAKGDALVLAVNDRPAKGSRGYYRVRLKHGVSKLHSGHRRTLGIIFHDAT